MHPPAQATRRAQVVEALADAVPAVDHAPPIHVAVDGLDDPATRALADDLDRQAVRPGPPLPAGDPGRPQPPPPGRPRGGTTRPPCRAGRRPGGGGRLLPPAPGVPWRMGSGRVPALGPSGAPRPVRGPRPGHGRRPVPHPGRPRGHRRGRGRPARPRLAGDPPHEPAAGRPPRPRGVPGRDPALFAPGGHVGTALPRRRPGLRAAVAEVGLHPGQTALDAGCGTGRALPHLRAAVGPAGRVLGLDLTTEMLATARAHGRHAHALLALAARHDRRPRDDGPTGSSQSPSEPPRDLAPLPRCRRRAGGASPAGPRARSPTCARPGVPPPRRLLEAPAEVAVGIL